MPNRRGEIFAADLRMMVSVGPDGFSPMAMYARRAASPLADTLSEGASSWDMLGTNLSFKKPDGSWGSSTERLLLMDSRDYARLGLGLDDLVEAYVQTVLAVTAIDRMAGRLTSQRGRLRRRLFRRLNRDESLLEEILA